MKKTADEIYMNPEIVDEITVQFQSFEQKIESCSQQLERYTEYLEAMNSKQIDKIMEKLSNINREVAQLNEFCYEMGDRLRIILANMDNLDEEGKKL